jgi:hypothetical protein
MLIQGVLTNWSNHLFRRLGLPHSSPARDGWPGQAFRSDFAKGERGTARGRVTRAEGASAGKKNKEPIPHCRRPARSAAERPQQITVECTTHKR